MLKATLTNVTKLRHKTGEGELSLSQTTMMELANQTLFIYKANEIVGSLKGQWQEVICWLFPALV